MCGVFEAQPTTVKANTTAVTIAVDVKTLPEIVRNNSNVEIVKKLQEYGPVKVVPPPEEFRGPSLNEMKKIELVTQVLDEKNKVMTSTIKLDDKYAIIDVSGEKRILARDDNANIVELFGRGKDLSKRERKASLNDELNRNRTLTGVGQATMYKITDDLHFESPADKNTAKSLAKEGAETGDYSKYVEFIKNKGLYDQFLNLLVRELEKMTKGGAGADSVDMPTAYDQNVRLFAQANKDLDQVRGREEDAVKKGGGGVT